jgi:peptidoglycan/LPS O-acetylase OafA/YrhL
MGAIRFTLAVSVAVWHLPGAPFRLLNAAVAVLAFFIISGFYMAMVLTEKYSAAKPFYAARFLRLYPAYAAVAAFMVLWFVLTNSPTPFTMRLPVTLGEQAALAVLNVAVVGQDFYEFSRNAFGSGKFLNAQWMLVGQAWSLSSEIFFYCLAPFVVRSATRTVTLLVLALATRWALIGWLGLSSPVWGYFFFPGTLCMFLLGSLAYHAHIGIRSRLRPWLGYAVLAAWTAWIVHANVTAGIVMPNDPQTGMDGPGFWTFYLLFAASVPIVFTATKDDRFDRAAGELSYPLYLVHGIVQGAIFFKFGAPQGHIGWAVTAISASVIVAFLLRLFVERSVESLRRHRKGIALAMRSAA